MRIAKGIIVNVCEDDMVEGEMSGEKEFHVFVEYIDRNCERCRIWISLYIVWLDGQ